VAAAIPLRIPIVVMEQNAVPGASNRFAGRWAKVCAVSFAGTDLPHAVHTGNPSTSAILAVDREHGVEAAKRRLGVSPDRHLVAAFGGSLGSRRVNQAVVDATTRLADRSDLAIRHIVGERDWPLFGDHRVDGDLEYQPIRYERAMHDVYAAATFVVARSGATSVAEIAVTGTPAVLIPLPGAPGDHQTRNARALTDVGGAILVPDAELDGPRVVALVEELLADPERLHDLSRAAREQGRPHAVEAIADLVEEHAHAR
jgi:UDP-N-acetylglucosamine--N-acetylmuramyl-(pentapeptide) pyrophosphoryl-undecaprenol N-acetylglucosamine transferase